MRRTNKESEGASHQTSYLIEMILIGTFIEREKNLERSTIFLISVFNLFKA